MPLPVEAIGPKSIAAPVSTGSYSQQRVSAVGFRTARAMASTFRMPCTGPLSVDCEGLATLPYRCDAVRTFHSDNARSAG